jgi:hypothetical protein
MTEVKIVPVQKTTELLKIAILFEDSHFIKTIIDDLMELKDAIREHRAEVGVCELCVRYKNYHKLENMPFVIMSLMPLRVQKDYIAGMIITPNDAIRWLYAIRTFNKKEYPQAVSVLDTITIKYRGSSFTRDEFRTMVGTEADILATHRSLIEKNQRRIELDQIRNAGKKTPNGDPPTFYLDKYRRGLRQLHRTKDWA